jgi:hypothetical protein
LGEFYTRSGRSLMHHPRYRLPTLRLMNTTASAGTVEFLAEAEANATPNPSREQVQSNYQPLVWVLHWLKAHPAESLSGLAVLEDLGVSLGGFWMGQTEPAEQSAPPLSAHVSHQSEAPDHQLMARGQGNLSHPLRGTSSPVGVEGR